jgi:hypothetical protein
VIFFNQPLLKSKKDCIYNQSSQEWKSELELYCLFHTIPICFHVNSKKEIEALTKLIPKAWMRNVKVESSHEVYLHDPVRYGFDLENFVDEESQDCFIDDQGKLSIQRDFAALETDQQKTDLLVNLNGSDGLHNFMRWFLPRKLMKKKILVLHSSSVINDKGEALLFLGHSGAGKTTITTLAGNRVCLGDDMNLLQCIDDEFYISAGAIGGTTDHTEIIEQKFPLKYAFWLKQSDKIEINIMTQSLSAAKYLASMSNLFWDSLNNEEISFLMNYSVKLAKKISLYELDFTKDQEFWNYVE